MKQVNNDDTKVVVTVIIIVRIIMVVLQRGSYHFVVPPTSSLMKLFVDEGPVNETCDHHREANVLRDKEKWRPFQ